MKGGLSFLARKEILGSKSPLLAQDLCKPRSRLEQATKQQQRTVGCLLESDTLH
jgi:hypothetical protein